VGAQALIEEAEMARRLLALTPVLAVLVLASPAMGATTGQTITATGTSQVKVVPTDRKRNASIVAAVEAAHRAGIAGALAQAHEYGLAYARAVGLTLGGVVSVSDVTNPNGGFYGGGFFGAFGPNQYCGIQRQPVFKIVKHKRKVVRFKKVHRCFVPPFQATSLTVTYSAS
jgi:hypothetical protein